MELVSSATSGLRAHSIVGWRPRPATSDATVVPHDPAPSTTTLIAGAHGWPRPQIIRLPSGVGRWWSTMEEDVVGTAPVKVGFRPPHQLFRDGAAAVRRAVEEAEDLGIDQLCVGDHV